MKDNFHNVVEIVSILVGVVIVIAGIFLSIMAQVSVGSQIFTWVLFTVSGLCYCCPRKYLKKKVFQILVLLVISINLIIFAQWMVEGAKGDGGIIILSILALMVLKPISIIGMMRSSSKM